MPANHDFVIWRGNNDASPTIEPRGPGDAVFDHTGSTWRLVARVASDAVLFDIAGVLDAQTGRVTFPITLEMSRQAPLGKSARYEIERRVGSTEETWLYGYLVGAGGANTDG